MPVIIRLFDSSMAAYERKSTNCESGAENRPKSQKNGDGIYDKNRLVKVKRMQDKGV